MGCVLRESPRWDKQCDPGWWSLRNDTCLLSLYGEDSEKEQRPLPELLSGRKLPLALILMPNNSIPPCMFLVPFKLLPPCWCSEGVSLSKSVYGPCKNCLGLQKFLSFTVSIPLDFTAYSYGDLSSKHWNPWPGSLVWG